MGDAEELCKHCELDPDQNYGNPNNGYYGCEGSQCKEAYERYLEENEITETIIKIKNKTIVTIERDKYEPNIKS